MENHISGMPLWASILFIATFIYSIFFITKPLKKAALDAGITPQKSKRIQIGIVIFYLVYLTYVSVLSLKGVFDVNSLPPKVMVWAGMPLLLILFVFIGNTRLYKVILKAIKLESLIALHIFRLLGVFFFLFFGFFLLSAFFVFSVGLGVFFSVF